LKSAGYELLELVVAHIAEYGFTDNMTKVARGCCRVFLCGARPLRAHSTSTNGDSFVYISKPEHQQILLDRVPNSSALGNNAVVSSVYASDSVFAIDIWRAKPIIVGSISQASKQLNSLNRYWVHHPSVLVRRGELIAAQLRVLPREAGATRRNVSGQYRLNYHSADFDGVQCFTMTSPNTILASSARMRRRLPPDSVFQEDKVGPPNRAYLKLWEAFSLLGRRPVIGDTVLDCGAAPGGWTFVAGHTGANVVAVDKAPLDGCIQQLPNVKFIQQSAFSLSPANSPVPLTQHTWLLADIACYPYRLLEWIRPWVESARKSRTQLIVTIKLHGEPGTWLSLLQPFLQLHECTVHHLRENKHEATLFCPGIRIPSAVEQE
jgi:23S rRNA (cytidine2498-2'-O)-methyltransferase